MTARDGGKGDRQRPLGVPKEQFESNWDAIFGKNKLADKVVKQIEQAQKADKDLMDYQQQAAQLWNDSCTSNRGAK